MDNFLSLLPQIILAQALGVGFAWGVDAASWKNRATEVNLARLQFFWMCVSLAPLIFLSYAYLPLRLLIFASLSTMFWLAIVTWVQKRRSDASYFLAFVGAFVRFFGFAVLLVTPLLLRDEFLYFLSSLFWTVYFATSILTHALLSLFRPTIYGAWNSLRQNFKANRPMK